MGYCEKCGKKLEDDNKFCVYCGKEVVKTYDAHTTEKEGTKKGIKYLVKIAGEKLLKFMQKAVNSIPKSAGKLRTMCMVVVKTIQKTFARMQKANEENRIKEFSDILVYENEEIIGIIGAGYLKNLIGETILGKTLEILADHTINLGVDNKLNKGFGILTDQRFYYRGICYDKVAGNIIRREEEKTVDLQDIMETGFVHYKYITLCILAIISFVIATSNVIENVDHYTRNIFTIISINLNYIIPIIFLFAYFIFRKTIYDVYYGEHLLIKVTLINLKKIRKFDKKLREAKDKLVAEKETATRKLTSE